MSEGTQRLRQLARARGDLKHWHVQFNIIKKETLLAAQKEPEKYRYLIVRIAGYSACFTELSPALQAEIITRKEESVGSVPSAEGALECGGTTPL